MQNKNDDLNALIKEASCSIPPLKLPSADLREAPPAASSKCDVVAPGEPHTHRDRRGRLIECYHKCRHTTLSTITSPPFWFGVTFSFPIEHFLWEKVFPFNAISAWLGL